MIKPWIPPLFFILLAMVIAYPRLFFPLLVLGVGLIGLVRQSRQQKAQLRAWQSPARRAQIRIAQPQMTYAQYKTEQRVRAAERAEESTARMYSRHLSPEKRALLKQQLAAKTPQKPCTEGGPCEIGHRRAVRSLQGIRVASLCTKCDRQAYWQPFLGHGK